MPRLPAFVALLPPRLAPVSGAAASAAASARARRPRPRMSDASLQGGRAPAPRSVSNDDANDANGARRADGADGVGGADGKGRAGVDVRDLRVNYSAGGVDMGSFQADPTAQFGEWLGDAVASGSGEANAMCLATADARGAPSARMVLLKAYDARGFVWYTGYGSRKGQELAANPRAALVFWWADLERSVRIEGMVARVGARESDAYFAARPPLNRLAACVSDQSAPVASRAALAKRWHALRAKHLDDAGAVVTPIPRPPAWGGFRLTPTRFEFWKGREARLHDRIEYSREDATSENWIVRRLQP